MKIICLFRILASMSVHSKKFNLKNDEKTVYIYYCDNLLAA